jgi:hypothetical protein
LVIVGVVLDRSTTDSFAAFKKAGTNLTRYLNVQRMTGEVDYFVNLRIKGIDSFNGIPSAPLVGLPSVRKAHSFARIKEVFETTMIPV